MSELHKIENEVRAILIKNTMARGNDRYLYLCYLREKGYDLDATLEAYLMSNEYPSYDTISRARRKAQERDEMLKPSEKVIEERKKLEQDFLKYARH